MRRIGGVAIEVPVAPSDQDGQRTELREGRFQGRQIVDTEHREQSAFLTVGHIARGAVGTGICDHAVTRMDGRQSGGRGLMRTRQQDGGQGLRLQAQGSDQRDDLASMFMHNPTVVLLRPSC